MTNRISKTAILATALFLIASAGAAHAAPALEVFSVAPAFSPFDEAGRTVTVKGVGFTASTTVTVDGVAASATWIDGRTLEVTLPTVADERVTDVVVSDPANGSDQFYPFLYTGPVIYIATTGNDQNNGQGPHSPKLTLAAALDEVDGTTPSEVRVAGGYYQESELAIFSATALSCGWDPNFVVRDPDRHVTDIDADHSGWVIRTAGLENVSIIDGCTLRNGLRDGFGGGGLVISADSLVVNNSVIAGNMSTSMGGAAYFIASTSYGGKPTFSNTVMVGNRAHNKNGGGIVIYPNYNTQKEVRVNVSGNQIVGNRSVHGRGGGVALTTSSYAGYNTGKLKVAGNLIGYNRAKTGAGLEVALLTSGDFFDLTIDNNLAVGNEAPASGGGFSLQGVGTLDGRMGSSTATGNSAAFGLGGGLLISSSLTLSTTFSGSDMILWNNVGGDAGGLALGLLEYSLSGTPLGGIGNISADPAFVSGPMGGFYLRQADPNQADSPAVDAGAMTASDLSVDSLTTRTDSLNDTGIADLGYHYLPEPGPPAGTLSLLRVDPPEGDLHGRDWVLVRGDRFEPGSLVSFDGTDAEQQIYLGETRILARPAGHGLGAVDVRVTNPDASFVDLAAGYTYRDTEAPVWSTTVGLVSARSEVDLCARSVILEWNPAIDTDSPPVVYEIYREECIDSLSTTIPCDNFGYIPNAVNFQGTTPATSWVDTDFGNQDKEWLYTVRVRDSAAFRTNKEWNLAKRLVLSITAAVEVPPSPIGETMGWATGSAELLQWAIPVGAVNYNLYRETDPSLYGTPASLVPFAILDPATNDGDGDGITDPEYTDAALPAAGQVFYYRTASVDPCGTLGEGDL